MITREAVEGLDQIRTEQFEVGLRDLLASGVLESQRQLLLKPILEGSTSEDPESLVKKILTLREFDRRVEELRSLVD